MGTRTLRYCVLWGVISITARCAFCQQPSELPIGEHFQAYLSSQVASAKSIKQTSYTYEFKLRAPYPPGFFRDSEMRGETGETISRNDELITAIETHGLISIKYDGYCISMLVSISSADGTLSNGRKKDVLYRTIRRRAAWIFDPDHAVTKEIEVHDAGNSENIKVTSAVLVLQDLLIGRAVLPELLHITGVRRINNWPQGRNTGFPLFNHTQDGKSSSTIDLVDEAPAWAMLGGPKENPWSFRTVFSMDLSSSRPVSQEASQYNAKRKERSIIDKSELSWKRFNGILLPTDIHYSSPGNEGNAGLLEMTLKLVGEPLVECYAIGEKVERPLIAAKPLK